MTPGHMLSIAAIQSCSLVSNIKPFNTVAVLMYHNVSDEIEPSYRSIRVKDFHEQMRFLKNKCEVLDIHDLVNLYYSPRNIGKTKKPRVVITMDDGFRDNYTNAFPILKKFGLPATIFVVSQWSAQAEHQPQGEFLNFQEMNEMRNHGMTFCSHTHTHVNLSKLNFYEQHWQIQKGIRELYDRFGDARVLDVFAYPFGEYNQHTLEILKDLKVKIGLTVLHQHNGPVENPLIIKRLTADGRDHIIKFAGQLNPYVFKAYQWYLKHTKKTHFSDNGSLSNLESIVYDI